jgi:hypothetical protein
LCTANNLERCAIIRYNANPARAIAPCKLNKSHAFSPLVRLFCAASARVDAGVRFGTQSTRPERVQMIVLVSFQSGPSAGFQ